MILCVVADVVALLLLPLFSMMFVSSCSSLVLLSLLQWQVTAVPVAKLPHGDSAVVLLFSRDSLRLIVCTVQFRVMVFDLQHSQLTDTADRCALGTNVHVQCDS
jgi:hypothetical protein